MARGEVPIDRGWAWMCVLGCATCNFIFTGFLRSLGILALEIMNHYGTSAVKATTVLGVMSLSLSISSPIWNRLAVRYTYRAIILISVAIFSVSYLLMSVAPNITVVFFAMGILGGIGFCGIFGPPLVVVGQYFNTRRSLANGFSTAGGSLGQLTLPIFTRYLFDNYGYTGGLIILSAFALHCLPAALLFRPFSFFTSRKTNVIEMKPTISAMKVEGTEKGNRDDHLCNTQNQSDKQNDMDTDEKLPTTNVTDGNIQLRPLIYSKSEHSALNESKHSLHASKSRINQLIKAESQSSLKHWLGSSNSLHLNPLRNRHTMYTSTASLSILEHQDPPKAVIEQELDDKELDSPGSAPAAPVPYASTKDEVMATFCCACVDVPIEAKPWFEWSLFKNVMFILYICGMCMGNSGVVNCCTFLPPRAMDIGIDRVNAALLLSIVGGSDFIGRIFGGWFADLGYIKRYKLMSGTLIITGITALICNYVKTYTSFVLLACVLGFIGGSYIALFVVVLVDFVGLEKLPAASGLSIMCLGIFNIPIPTIMGTVKDATGTFELGYTMLGIMTILAGICYAMEPLARRIEAKITNQSVNKKFHSPIYKPCTTEKY